MRYNFSKKFPASEEFNTQYQSRQIVDCIHDLALDLMHSLRCGDHRFDLIAHYNKLSKELDALWFKAGNGLVRVDSIAILRAIRKVICADIGASLKQPVISRKRLQTEIALLITAINQFLLPDINLSER